MRSDAWFAAAWRACALTFLLALCANATARPPATLPDVSHESARSSPDWVRNGIVYEIFPRDFSPSGDFAGVTAQLDRLKQLGVTILWLMPIQPLGQLHKKGTYGSPYAVRDYAAINPEYGTPESLHALVGAAHARGMKIIIDMVANHTSWDSVLMSDPAFYKHEGGRIIPPEPDWEDVAQLDYDNPKLRQYMIGMMSNWIRDYDLDGFRCDAASYVPTSFWEQTRSALERIKPDIIMLAEADQPDLLVNAFDVDYDWKLHDALERAINGEAPATALSSTWRSEAARYPHGALRMRFSDNHDKRRAISRFGESAAIAASALMLTLDGVPMLYNGMEVGDGGESASPALFERLPIYWDSASLRPGLTPFYVGLIELRKSHAALTSGDVEWLHNSDEAHVVTFLRRAPEETLLVAVNLSNRPFSGQVQGAHGDFLNITPPVALVPGAVSQSASLLPALDLPPWGYRVYRSSPGR
jgi:cyclomaltodextrinase / maltogenic alpha-amylase / neopullulanase